MTPQSLSQHSVEEMADTMSKNTTNSTKPPIPSYIGASSRFGSGLSLYWNIIAIALGLLSLIVAFGMDMGNPFVFVPVIVVFGSAMFTLGFTLREAMETVDRKTESLVEQAARRAVERRMPEIEEMVDRAAGEAVDEALLVVAREIDSMMTGK